MTSDARPCLSEVTADDRSPSATKTLITAEAARSLGLEPDQFRRFAVEADLTPRKHGKHHLWSEADVEVVRGLAERRG